MSSIWNILNPLRTGFVKLAPAGKELYGTVVRHGKSEKTVSVRCDFQFWNNKYRKYYHSSSKYLVHDEKSFCVTGDKVVIKACRPITRMKHYFIRNIVKPFPRNVYYTPRPQKRDPKLEAEYEKLLNYYMKQEFRNRPKLDNKRKYELKKAVKQKALSKAIQNIKKLEKLQEIKEQNLARRLARRQQAEGGAPTENPAGAAGEGATETVSK